MNKREAFVVLGIILLIVVTLIGGFGVLAVGETLIAYPSPVLVHGREIPYWVILALAFVGAVSIAAHGARLLAKCKDLL